MGDAFTAVLGDRRGSGRVDPPHPRWWRALGDDPRCRRVVEVLDNAYATGLRWMEIVPDPETGPWRLHLRATDDALWELGVDHDLGLLDYHRDRIMQLWDAGELVSPPSSGAVLAGWLWEQ